MMAKTTFRRFRLEGAFNGEPMQVKPLLDYSDHEPTIDEPEIASFLDLGDAGQLRTGHSLEMCASVRSLPRRWPIPMRLPMDP